MMIISFGDFLSRTKIRMGYDRVQATHFHWIDHLAFAVMLIVSAMIGIYFGYFKRKKFADTTVQEAAKQNFGSKNLTEYMLGSRELTTFPVAMSLIASYISGVTILGTAPEIYNFGTQYWLIIFSIMLMGVTVAYVYLPVYNNLKLCSSYQYLELRFSGFVRSYVSIMFVLDEVLFLPMVIYVPALAFNQVTGVNHYLIVFVITAVCTLYTLLGGMKAVVSTDAWQVVVMFLAVIVVTIVGIAAVDGGFGMIFKRADEGERFIFFNMSLSPYERHTFWSVIIGGYFYWTSYNAINQTMVQRYMSLPNISKGRYSILIYVLGIIMFITLCCFDGLLIYSKYYDCDPLTSNLIMKDDQMVPAYVMETAGHLHGIPGLFIAGIVGAALSSLSVILNSTAGVLLEDIARGIFKLKLSEKAATYFVKGSVIMLSIVAIVLVFIIERLEGVLLVASSLSAIAAGTTFGMVTLGMLNPWANPLGAIIGGIAGTLLSGWVSLGTQIAIASGTVTPKKLPTSISGCSANITAFEPEFHDESDVFPLHRLSFHWITPIGVSTVLLVGSVVSWITGPSSLKKLDPDLVSPVIHRFLPKDIFLPPRSDAENLTDRA